MRCVRSCRRAQLHRVTMCGLEQCNLHNFRSLSMRGASLRLLQFSPRERPRASGVCHCLSRVSSPLAAHGHAIIFHIRFRSSIVFIVDSSGPGRRRASASSRGVARARELQRECGCGVRCRSCAARRGALSEPLCFGFCPSSFTELSVVTIPARLLHIHRTAVGIA